MSRTAHYSDVGSIAFGFRPNSSRVIDRSRDKNVAVLLFLISITVCSAQQVPQSSATGAPASSYKQDPLSAGTYLLGPGDSILIRVLDAEEVVDTPYEIDLAGNVDLPRVGRTHAQGLTVDQLKAELVRRFREYLQNPIVSVSVSEFRSQPIYLLGEVNTPGVRQLRGRKTLFEVISEAGGLRPEAGNSIKITRRKEWGALPLPGAVTDPTGEYSVADVSISAVMRAQNPQENIAVRPNDTITVPKADLVYVIGAVKRSGGFVLSEKASLSVLEALSMAEGLDRTANTGGAKILRHTSGSTDRSEIPVDLKKLMNGKGADVPLLANDILFVPNSVAKSISLRTLEALVQTGTGLAIYRPF